MVGKPKQESKRDCDNLGKATRRLPRGVAIRCDVLQELVKEQFPEPGANLNFSKACGVSFQSALNWIYGKNNPSERSFADICAALSVHDDELRCTDQEVLERQQQHVPQLSPKFFMQIVPDAVDTAKFVQLDGAWELTVTPEASLQLEPWTFEIEITQTLTEFRAETVGRKRLQILGFTMAKGTRLVGFYAMQVKRLTMFGTAMFIYDPKKTGQMYGHFTGDNSKLGGMLMRGDVTVVRPDREQSSEG